MKIENKKFVVTGAGSGIGREVTLLLVAKGAEAAIIDINKKGLEETAELAEKTNVSIHVLDISDRERVGKLPEAVIRQHGNIDGLINVVGIIQPFVDVKDLDYNTIERIFNVNFFGALYIIKAFLPYLLERPEAHIANISSMGGFLPFPGQTMYSASKAALKMLTEGLYSELKNTNVGVTVIHPGAVNTNIMVNSGIKMPDINKAASQKILQPDKAAVIIVKAIEKNKYRVMAGKDALILDLLYRISPKRAVDLIVKKMGANLRNAG